MQRPVLIRKYEPGDKAGLQRVFQSNVPLYFGEHEWSDFAEFLEVDLWQGCRYDVLVQDEKIIGAGGIGQNEDGTVSLIWGMVDAGFHKQGLGKLLLEHRLALAMQLYLGCTLISSTSQHTYGFFEKYGFVTRRIENDYWASGLHLYHMEKHI